MIQIFWNDPNILECSKNYGLVQIYWKCHLISKSFLFYSGNHAGNSFPLFLDTIFQYSWIFFYSNNIGKDRWCQWVIIFWKILFQIFWNFCSNYFGIDNSFKIEIFQLFWISQMALGSKWLLPLPLPLPLLKRDMQKRSQQLGTVDYYEEKGKHHATY